MICQPVLTPAISLLLAAILGLATTAAAAPGATIAAYEVSEMCWQAPRNRQRADEVRIEVAEMLERLR